MADHADLEQLAFHLEQSGDYRILRRVAVMTRYADDDPAAVKRLGLIVDIETTGLDPACDRIIELACLPFHFSSEGVLYDVLPGYAGFEDPGQPLHEDVVRLTGITNDQLLGHKLDDHAVTALAAPANLIIAHNAVFDRCFLERRFPLFVDKPWACSFGQVPWTEEGFGSAKLDYLLRLLLRRSPGDGRLPGPLASVVADPAPQRPADPAPAAGERPSACLPHLGPGGTDRVQGPPEGAGLPLEQWRGRSTARVVP
jgi:hypothetical protein